MTPNDRAHVAILAYLEIPGVDEDSFFTDLLCDLMHWVDHNYHPTFDEALDNARRHYEAETTSCAQDGNPQNA
jgi:hypothetical protein